ncbi:hypothetical protein ACJX0J_015578, partial [Zea mays]
MSNLLPGLFGAISESWFLYPKGWELLRMFSVFLSQTFVFMWRNWHGNKNVFFCDLDEDIQHLGYTKGGIITFDGFCYVGHTLR